MRSQWEKKRGGGQWTWVASERKLGCKKSPTVTPPITRHIGLDVHKNTIAVAVAEEGADPSFLKTISHDLHAVEKLVRELREGGRYA